MSCFISQKTKAIVIACNISVVTLFTLESLLFTVAWGFKQFACKVPPLDAENSTNSANSHFDHHSLSSSTDHEIVDGKFYRLFDVLFILVKYLHIPEQIFLWHYLFEFLRWFNLNNEECVDKKSWNVVYKTEIREKMFDFVKTEKSLGRAFLFMTVAAFFMILAVVIPPIEIFTSHKNGFMDKRCSSNVNTLTLSITFAIQGMSLLTNTIDVLECFLMIFFTIVIGAIWKLPKPATDQQETASAIAQGESQVTIPAIAPGESQETASVIAPGRDPENVPDRVADEIQEMHSEAQTKVSKEIKDLYEVCERHKETMNKYIANTVKVKPIYNIFRSYFVLHWIIHVFRLSFHIAKLVRPWIKYGQDAHANDIPFDDLMMIINGVLLVLFDGLALVITYTCALKMNAYLRRYIRKLQKEQLESVAKSPSTLQYSLTHLFLIKAESVSKANFTPRIPGTGLYISISSPSFVLTIVFGVFGLIGAHLY